METTTITTFDDCDNYTTPIDGPWVYDLCSDDATWILMASFIIFTMQTGFGMLESGCVSLKNEANIMVKNVVDVALGGLTYWIFGFSLSFGRDPGSSSFLGIGDYAVDSEDIRMGPVFAALMFHLSFATTATTIVSGSMAERTNFKAYCIFSLLNTFIFCVSARWLWDPTGFLNKIGVIDVAGSAGVHILGGTSGFVAAWMLGPRMGRYDNGIEPLPLGAPLNSLVGLFVLWWGWLAFNSGSTYGVRSGKWKFATRAAVNTMIASIGGGTAASGYSFIRSRPGSGKYFEINNIVNPILGSLVASTAGCALYHTHEAFFIGFTGSGLVIAVSSFADRLGVDDPVGATAVHAFGGIWGMMAVGFFAENDHGLSGLTKEHSGIFRGGGTYLLQVQLFACVCVLLWSGISTFILLWVINKFIAIRIGPEGEKLGLDFVTHSIRRDLISGEVITTHKNCSKIEENLLSVSVIQRSSIPCHVNIIGQSFIKFNHWRKIRTKAIAASIFSGRFMKNRIMSSRSVVAQSISFEENDEYFKRRYMPKQIYITENFYQQNFVTKVENNTKVE